MENERSPIVFRATLRSNPSSIFPSSPNYSSGIQERCFSVPKIISHNQPLTQHNTSISNLNSSNHKYDANTMASRQQDLNNIQPIYKTYETNHLLNRIKYLEGIIKQKQRRHLEQMQSLSCHNLQSKSPSMITINENQRLILSESKSKAQQLQLRIQQLQKQKEEQKEEYERKIKTMQQYMQTHFIQVQSEIVDQQWKARDEFFINSLCGSRVFNQDGNRSVMESATEH